jgi:hypothetical protein
MNLLAEDGNIFAILGRASRLLRQNGQSSEVEQMYFRVTSSNSYDEALRIISEYVETELSVPEASQEDAIRDQLTDIAKHHIYAVELRGDLQYRGNDDADFINVSVGSIEGALRAAYDLGREAGQPERAEHRPAKRQKKGGHRHER